MKGGMIMSYDILEKVNSPADLKALDEKELLPLCGQIREFLIDKVGHTGGHLASNLGVTELTVALHRVFDSPNDHIIFDVGHQAYVHKMLTGRRDKFDYLRRPGGLSGFTLMRESEHDAFGAGHSSTSISAALGYAESDNIQGKDNYTVCVIGDGAYTGGMVHEAINNCKPDLKLIIILNENGMSISTNKGAFASYLSRVRMSRGYIGMKEKTGSFLSHIPLIGKPIKAFLTWVKNGVKKVVFTSSYFEELGFYYLGPIDGNDYKKVERALREAKRLNKCVFVHIKTTKGKGCEEAERSPEEFHSIASSRTAPVTYHSVFADELIQMAKSDDRIVAITAAMGVGTGLNAFEENYPNRYFDVGIAEEHALTFAAGLAASGLKPFAAIYSTFLQRGYDNILHDIALQGLPVKLLIDRAGIATADGATHHGIFDVAFLSHTPGMEIISPSTHGSLRAAVRYAAECNGPIAVRYSNSTESRKVVERFYKDGDYRDFGIRCDFNTDNTPANIFITYGKLIERVIEASDILCARGIECGIVLVERLKPYDPLVDFLVGITKGRHILFAEEGIKNGGAAMITRDMLWERGALADCEFDIAAINDDFLSPTELCDIYDFAGLSSEKLAGYFLK